MKRCRTCRFIEVVGKGQRNGTGEEIEIGICRRKPPAIGPVAYPLTSLDFDWCGEFKSGPVLPSSRALPSLPRKQ
jgi:hypothetical protein